jgi:PAS domain S-box/diguanylate cyclase (GGDEF) domain
MDNLKTSVNQFQLLAHALAEGILLFDRKGVVQYLNPEAERLLGWDAKETVGLRTYRDLFDPAETHDEKICIFEHVMITQTVVSVEKKKIYRLNGSKFFSRLIVSPVEDNGVVVGCTLALTDISELDFLREELQESWAEIQKLKFKEQRENILYGIIHRVLIKQPLPDIFQYLCVEMVNTMGYPVAYIALKEKDGSSRIVAQCGLSETEIPSFQMCWNICQQLKIYNLKDVAHIQPWQEIFKKLALSSVAIFPISSNNNRVKGILTLYSQREDYFDAERVGRLQSLAEHLDLVFWTAEGRGILHLQNMALAASVHSIVILDGEGKILWTNSAFTRLTGYTLKAVLGHTLRFLRSGYQDNSFYKRLWDSVMAGHTWQGELLNRRADGTLYFEEMTITPVKAEGEKITHFIAVKLDVSERVANQRALRDSEEQLREMFETMNSAVVVFRISEDGQDFICTDINRVAEKVENISREQAIGSSIVRVFPLIKELGLLKLCFQVFKTGKRVHFPAVFFKNQRATGWSEGVIYKLSTGKIVFLYDEVSQRVLNENALWQEKERAQVTLASIGDAVLTTDVDGNVTYLNPIAETMTGWRNEEAQGLRIENVFDIFHERTGQPMAQPIWRCLQEDRVIELSNHAVLRHRGGQQRYYIDDSAAPIRDREGRVIGAVLVFHDVSEKRELQRRLIHQAHYDALTDLPNRQLFKECVDQAILHSRHLREYVAVFFIDLDGFKLVNDTLGHTAGDSLLCQVGERFREILRQEDTVARQGGDEFLILMSNLHSARQAEQMAQKLLNVFDAPFQLLNQEVYLTASLGIALYPSDGENSEILIQHADMAMYQVKAEGSNHFTFYTRALNERLAERLALQNEMRPALGKNEFVLYYQPLCRLSDGQLCGMEALVRWQHPERGFLLPGKFIPIAEESGLILPLGEWILRTACAQNKLWQDMGYPPVCVSVNLSARQFRQKDLVKQVDEVLKETGLDPRWLTLEITESLSMENVVRSVEILQKLRDMGIQLSIDDFGTGFSSLSYLSRFSLNTLKIDRSFISKLNEGLDGQAIVLSIIQLAQNLSLNVIAEGVETQTQLDTLRTMGCDEVQGFFLAKPSPVEEMQSYLSNHRLLK